ncbi:L-threonylcarbamoyladenylate synthase [Alphaproteobacteria bacterium]|nr:L-threonylcarbamoyladenylate synthase [Alphaproteobacteria bacterium]
MKTIIISAKKTLESGNLVIFPTETVYGIGGDATNLDAIKKIYSLKKRPFYNPLICHFNNIEAIEKNFEISKQEFCLGKAFWPGPMTIILKKKKTSSIQPLLSNNLEFVGCRIPKHPIALDLLTSVNFPIAAPSANIATKISSTQTNHLSSELKENAFLIEGGKTTLGLESTVVKLNDNKLMILRLGSITEDEIKARFPELIIKNNDSNKNLSPGNQKIHYAPNLPIRINVNKVKKDEGLLNFGKNNLKSNICEYNLSEKGNLKEASKNFFHYLHLLDNSNCKRIAVANIPEVGLGKTINDRLNRASSKNE